MGQIRKCIVEGEYNLGDKLPSENELTKIFQISRPSVREALCGLTALGLIDAKAGGGYYVKSTNAFPTIDLMLNEEGNPLEILEARRIIEPEIAKVAARRRVKKDIDNLKKLIARAKAFRSQTPPRSIEPVIEIDMEIHRIFAQATHNEVLISVQQRLLDFMRKRGWKELQKRVDIQPSLVNRYWKEHEAICECISKGKPLKANVLMREHLKGIEKDLLKQAQMG
jgi:GntR family transcriptional repressor for pyruvate dehydrogenase complex